MINNTARERWSRAAARSLDAQFVAEVIHGMSCSPFEAEAIRDTVHAVYGPLMEASDTLKPGQIRLAVIDAEEPPNRPLAQARQRVVTLTLDGGAEDRCLRQQAGVIALRRQRFVRICEEAFQQGGLLTLEAVADLFNCAVRTLVSDLAAVRAQGTVPPLRSTVKDMGRAVTHRQQIVARWLAGLEYTEIAATTYHSLAAVANYVDKFKRCATLLTAGFDLDTVAVVARLSPALTRAFQQLAETAHPVPHRRAELEALAKKNAPGQSRPMEEVSR